MIGRTFGNITLLPGPFDSYWLEKLRRGDEQMSSETAQTPQAVREVPRLHNRLARATEELHTKIGDLEKRLIDYIKQPDSEKGEGKEQADLCGAAATIRDQAESVENATARISRILRDLQV